METSPDQWECILHIQELVSPSALDKQRECFQITMSYNSHHAMRAIDPYIHPLMKLWRNLNLSPMLPGVISEYFKLAGLAMIMVVFFLELLCKLEFSVCNHVGFVVSRGS